MLACMVRWMTWRQTETLKLSEQSKIKSKLLANKIHMEMNTKCFGTILVFYCKNANDKRHANVTDKILSGLKKRELFLQSWLNEFGTQV